MGSVAFGSFIIAVVRAIRAYLMYIQKQAETFRNNMLVKQLLCLIQCYMACLEKVCCLPVSTVCPQLLFALNCLPSTTVCPQLLFALN